MPESKENFNIPKAITPSKTPLQIFTNKRTKCFKRLRETVSLYNLAWTKPQIN